MNGQRKLTLQCRCIKNTLYFDAKYALLRYVTGLGERVLTR